LGLGITVYLVTFLNYINKQAARRLEVGQRVIHPTEGIGIVEEKDLIFPASVDIRWLTPNNEPSVLTSCVMEPQLLKPVSDSVVPMPKSKAWWEESRAFCARIENILIEEGVLGDTNNRGCSW